MAKKSWENEVKITFDDVFKDDNNKEERDNYRAEKINYVEEDEVNIEDIELASYGIIPKLMNAYLKREKNNKIFNKNGNLNQKAFEWYLSACSSKQLECIEKNKLSDTFLELLEKKQEKTDDIYTGKEEGIIMDYINKNAELIEQLDEMKEKVQEYKELTTVLNDNIKWLYDFLGNIEKCELKNITEDDIIFIEQIKELIK